MFSEVKSSCDMMSEIYIKLDKHIIISKMIEENIYLCFGLEIIEKASNYTYIAPTIDGIDYNIYSLKHFLKENMLNLLDHFYSFFFLFYGRISNYFLQEELIMTSNFDPLFTHFIHCYF